MLKISVNIFLIVTTLLCSAGGVYGDEVQRGNKFIDDLLRDMVNENGHDYDPYILEDSVISFSKQIMFVNFTGEAKLYNGNVKGLKSLHRPEQCSVREEDGRLHVTAELGAGVLDLNYDGTVKFMSYGPTIHIRGTLAYVETRMEFSVNSKTGRDGKLHKFVIDDLKGMSFKITGLGPLNWAMNYMIGSLNTMFSGFIKNMIEKTVRNHIAERLPNYEFPVEGEVMEAAEAKVDSIPDREVEKAAENANSLSSDNHKCNFFNL